MEFCASKKLLKLKPMTDNPKPTHSSGRVSQYSHLAPGGADLRECKHSDGSVLQWWRRTCTSFSQWRRLGEEERVCEERRRNH